MANKDFGCLRLIGRDRLAGLNGIFPDEIGLSAGRTIVGRSNKADIKLSAEKDGKFIISRSHAAIIVNEEANTVEIEDLGALNGIFVNEVRVKTSFLHDGDVIQFGGMSEVPIGKRLTGGDLSVCYVFREPGSTSQTLNLPQRPSPPAVRSDSQPSSTHRAATAAPNTLDDKFPQKRHAVTSSDVPSTAGTKTPADANVSAASLSSHKKRRTSPEVASTTKVAAESIKSTPVSTNSSSDRKISASKAVGPTASVGSVQRVPPEESLRQPSPVPVAAQCVTLRIPAASFVPGLQLSKESEIVSLLGALKEQQREQASGLLSLQSAVSEWQTGSLQRQSALQVTLEQHRQELREESRAALGGLRDELKSQLDRQAAMLAQLVAHIGSSSRNESQGSKPLPQKTECAALTCPICRELFLDACVLRCSHSLCFLCAAAWLLPESPHLDDYRRRPGVKRKTGVSKTQIVCPLCDATLGDGDGDVAGLHCAALDDAAFAAAQSDAAALKRYEQRREASFRIQQRLSASELRRLQGLLPSPALLSGAADGRDAGEPLSAEAVEGSDDDARGPQALEAHSDDEDGSQQALCDYCGERGHAVACCPHHTLRHGRQRDGDDGVEEDDEDEDDEEQDM